MVEQEDKDRVSLRLVLFFPDLANFFLVSPLATRAFGDNRAFFSSALLIVSVATLYTYVPMIHSFD